MTETIKLNNREILRWETMKTKSHLETKGPQQEM